MLKKARQEEHGSHPTILSRWYAQEKFRDSLAKHNVGEKEVMFFDRIAFERHQNPKHWIPRLNADGPQMRLRQRPEFAAALKQCIEMQDAHLAETRQSLRPIRPEQQRQGQDQQFEEGENFDYYVDRMTGWRHYREPRGNPPAASSSSTSQWQTSQWQASWSSWRPTSSEKWW